MSNSNEKQKILQNEPWLKEMWNDISINGVDLDWNIYQKNIDNYVIENDLSINLYTLFDYDEYLFNNVWYGKVWGDYKNIQPYNQNLRNLNNFKNKHGNNKSLFEYVDEMSFLKSEEIIFSDRYNNNKLFEEYFSNLVKFKTFQSNITINNKIKLHLTLKKLYILIYKHIKNMPLNYNYDIISLVKNNIYLHFNNQKLAKLPFKSKEKMSIEQKQRYFIEKIFWENEDISKHEELLINVIDFEQFSFDGITKVEKEINGYDIKTNVLKCDNKEKAFVDLYLKLLNLNFWKNEAHSLNPSWVEKFYHNNNLIWDNVQYGEKSIELFKIKIQFCVINVEANRKINFWNASDYRCIDLNNDTYHILYSNQYFERDDKKRNHPLYVLLNKDLNLIFLEKSLGRYIKKFVYYKYIHLHFNSKISGNLKQKLENKLYFFDDKYCDYTRDLKNKKYNFLKRIYTIEELNKIKKDNLNFLDIPGLKIKKIYRRKKGILGLMTTKLSNKYLEVSLEYEEKRN